MRRAVIALIACLGLALPVTTLALDHAGDASGTWLLADSPHRVLSTVRVPPGETLTIEPGCLVVFGAATRLQVEGTLVAEGTPDVRIDIAALGQGTPGEWKGIQLIGPGPHAIAHASIAHAVTAVAVAGGASLGMEDVVVYGSQGDALTFGPGSTGVVRSCALLSNGGGGIALRDASPVIDDCQFRSNGRAIWASGASFPVVSGLLARGNTAGDGILLDALADVRGEGSWNDGGIPWIVPDGGTLVIASSAWVGLGPGAVLKLGTSARIVVDGVLASEGRAGEPCVVTSLRDDSAGGDTNRDGATTAPGKGDWDAIEVSPGGLARLRGCVLRNGDDGIRALGGQVILADCDIHDMANRGAALGPLAGGIVLGTSFRDCDTGLLVGNPAAVAAGLPGGGPGSGGGNAFSCNASFDVDNQGAETLYVRNSWFGPSGPDPSRLGGFVDAGQDVVSEPARVEARRRLMVTAPPDGTVAFAWEGAGSCASYRLSSSQDPNGLFGTLARPATTTYSATLAELGASDLVYFRLDVE